MSVILTRRDTLRSAAALASTLVLPGLAGAQSTRFPNKSWRVLVPYAAGGTVDFVSRLVTQKMGNAWGQTAVVENRPGGATNIAAEAVARSAPDGYTLFAASRANAINAALPKKQPVDIRRDLLPIALLAEVPNVLVINPQVPARTVAEFIALAKSKPGAFSYASAGTGGSTHIAGELFNSMAGVDIFHVPYKGGSQAAVDVISGQVTMYFGTMPSVMPHVKTGKLRALAVTSEKRSDVDPSIPTLSESGLAGFRETSWIGLMAPAATPADIVALLHQSVQTALTDPDLKAQMVAQGANILPGSRADFINFLERDIASTARIVEKAKITVE